MVTKSHYVVYLQVTLKVALGVTAVDYQQVTLKVAPVVDSRGLILNMVFEADPV